MSKAVMIRIRPKWCAKIIIGRKTMELRKSVRNWRYRLSAISTAQVVIRISP